MLHKIITFSVTNKLVIGLFTIGLIAWGAYSVTILPIDAVPDITNNQVQVITVAPSSGAQDIERFVTFPVEQTMATIPGIQEIRSFSRFGLSIVTLVFKDNIDIYWGRQQVSERMVEATKQIPMGMGIPTLAPVTTGLGEIYQYIIHTKKGYESKYTAMDLRTIQDWIIRRQLLGVEGIADVSSFGGYLKQYEIALTPEKLRSMNISISDVFTALEKNNQNTGGAYIDKKPNAYFIRSEGLIASTEDIENIVVNNVNNTPVLIKNIGTVQFGSAIRYGAMTRNNEGEVVGAVVMMLKGANSSKAISNVKTRIQQIEKTLPEGVVMEPYLDRTKLVNSAISTVGTNLAEGAVIVIFVLVLLLGNLRAGLIVASVIPLAMLFAIIMMNLFNVSGNLMSLGALDFGLIVDGAVIIIEATLHYMLVQHAGQRLTQQEMDAGVLSNARKMMSSAAFGQIIILIVYLPILALVGVEGKMFRPMAQTVSFAILGAFILSLTYVPMMSALFLNKKISDKKNISDRIIGLFQRGYNPLIRFALHAKLVIIGIAIGLLILSIIVFNYLGAEFIPTLDEGDFAVETRVLTGSSMSQTLEAVQQGAKVLKDNFPEVKEVVGKIGSSEIPIDPMPVEAADMIVVLKDKEEWTSANNREALAEKMKSKLEQNIPGVSYSFQQPIQMRFNELMTGARQDVVIKIYGEDLNRLTEYAKKIGAISSQIKGAQDIYVEQMTGLPQIVIKFKRDKIAQFGLNIEDINRAIRSGFAGESAGLVFENEKRFDLVVRLDQKSRQNIDDIRGLFVTAPNGNQIPIDQVAIIKLEQGPNQIQRDDAKRRILVGFNVRGRDVESIVKEIEQKINQQVKFDPGYYTTYGGTFEKLHAARARLSIALPVALSLIFILLFFTFHSVKQSILIFTAIPLSAIGGVFALWIRGMPFSISAGVGFIALFGVAVLNGIVLIAEFNRLKKEGLTDLKQIVLKGTSVRLRPVIMTAAVASLGFLPMALSTGGGAEVQRPLATVVIGGLITATFLTLLVLPVLYIWFEKIKSKKVKLPVVAASACLTGFLLLAFMHSMAQQSMQPAPAQQIINLALQNNPTINSSGLQIEQQRILGNTSRDFGKTNIRLQTGQINSLRWDNSINIEQPVPNPAVFRSQKSYYDEKIKSSELNLAVTQNELVYQVNTLYHQLSYYEAQQKLLQNQDTLFANFLKAADLRYRTGESTLLERATAENQLNEIRNQEQRNQADISITKRQLERYVNAALPINFMADTLLKIASVPIMLDSGNSKNPEAAFIRQQINIADKNIAIERARAKPDFMVGYTNQSLLGAQLVNGQNKYFSAENRFHFFQAGISIPIFYKPYANRIKAAQVEKQIAQSNYQLYQLNWQGQYNQAYQEYLKATRNLQYFESSALANGDLILKQAGLAFKNGEIGYVEYLQALRTYREIRFNYLSGINEFNQTVIRLQYLSGISNQ